MSLTSDFIKAFWNVFKGIVEFCNTATFSLVVQGAKRNMVITALLPFTTIVHALISSVAAVFTIVTAPILA